MSQIDIIVPIVVGAIVGIAISFFFVQYGSVNTYQANVLGINSNNLISGIMLFSIVSGIAALSGMSAIIKDLEYIINEPFKFTIELLLMGLLPTIPIVAIIYFRTNKFNFQNKLESFALFTKFAAFHVLLQISGYYRYVFGA